MFVPLKKRLADERLLKKFLMDYLDKAEEELDGEPVPWWSKQEREWLKRLRELGDAYDQAADAANEAEKALKDCRDEWARHTGGGMGAYRGPDRCKSQQDRYDAAASKANQAWEAYLKLQDEFFEKFPHRKPQ